MAFTFIASAGNNDDSSGTLLSTTATLNLSAGDVVVVWHKWEGADTTVSCAKDAGSPANTNSLGSKINHSNGDLNGQFTYLLSASADGSAVFRQTLSASRPYRRILALQFRPDASETVSLDVQNTGQGSDLAPTSGSITTTGTDEIVIGGYGEYSANTTTSEAIGGTAATEPAASPQGFSSVWYRILSSTMSSGTATASIGSTAGWICNIIAIKSVAAGATGGGPLVGTGSLVRGSLTGSGRLVLS